MKLSYFLISTCLFFLFIACGPKYAVNKTYNLSNNEWTYADSLRFDFEIKDTLALYNLLLEVKHATDFSFQNLYTRIHTQFPDGTRLSKPVSLELADKIGTWQGDCNSKTCTLEIRIQEGAYFNKTGKYAVIVEQFMRENAVKGIQSVTLKVQETGEKRK